MNAQNKLISILFKLEPKNDNPDTFNKEVLPLLEAVQKQGITDFNFLSDLGDSMAHICSFRGLTNILASIYDFCQRNHLQFDLTRGVGNIGHTPMHIAAIRGDITLAQCLLSTINNEFATLEKPDHSGKLPIFFAAASFNPNPEIKNAMIKLMDPNETLRHKQDQFGQTAQDVLDNSPYSFRDKRNCFGQTPFMTDVIYSTENPKFFLKIKKDLINCASIDEKKALVNATDYCGRTALIYACYSGNTEAVDLLLPYANVNQQERIGHTPLHFAVFFRDAIQGDNKDYIIDALLNHGALNLPHHNGKTPAQIAKEHDLQDVAHRISDFNFVTPIEELPLCINAMSIRNTFLPSGQRVHSNSERYCPHTPTGNKQIISAESDIYFFPKIRP